MARSRTPTAKAAITGAAKKNPQRQKKKTVVKTPPVGNPPAWLSKEAKAAWKLFQKELPWLKENHRAFMEAICVLRGKLMSKEGLSATQTTTYQAMLSKLGATPADESKILSGEWVNNIPAPSSNDTSKTPKDPYFD